MLVPLAPCGPLAPKVCDVRNANAYATSTRLYKVSRRGAPHAPGTHPELPELENRRRERLDRSHARPTVRAATEDPQPGARGGVQIYIFARDWKKNLTGSDTSQTQSVRSTAACPRRASASAASAILYLRLYGYGSNLYVLKYEFIVYLFHTYNIKVLGENTNTPLPRPRPLTPRTRGESVANRGAQRHPLRRLFAASRQPAALGDLIAPAAC